MVYETRVKNPEKFAGRVVVELSRFEGRSRPSGSNDQRAVVVGWRPYRADVTQFVRPGDNQIGHRGRRLPRNLMGPRHSAEKYPRGPVPARWWIRLEPGYQITRAGLMGDARIVFVSEPK